MIGVQKSVRAVKRALRAFQGRDLWHEIQVRREELRLGNQGADWTVCPTNLSEHSVIYSFGVGEDISFDLKLIEEFGLSVHAFDPTPRSVKWIAAQCLTSNLHFHAVGVADFDGNSKFSPPVNQQHVSHTMLERKTPGPAVEVPVRRLTTIMKSLGHDRIDLLKMDIEGAEYAVLADLLASRIRIDQLLVEFHHRWPEIGTDKTRTAIKDLNAAGFQIFSVSATGEEYGFLRTGAS